MKVSEIWSEVLSRRFLSMVAGLIMMSVAGTLYSFSVWEPAMKEIMNFTQNQCADLGFCCGNTLCVSDGQLQDNFIGAMGNLGQYSGILQGLFYDRFGAKATSLLAGSEIFIGYMILYSCMKFFSDTPYIFLVMAFALALVGQGCHGTYTAAGATNAKLYGDVHRGRVLGILVTPFGISAAIFATIYKLEFKPDVIGFLLFVAIVCGVVNWLGLFLLYEPRRSESAANESDHSLPLVEEVDITGLQLLKTRNFWLLYVCLFAGAGAGLMYINNLGQLMYSITREKDRQHNAVISMSIFNALGRLVFGFLSDKSANKFPRAVWIVVILIMMSISHLVIALFPSPALIFWATPFIGLAYGGIFLIIPAILSLLFGMRHFGQNWGWIIFASGTGAFTYNMIASGLYQGQAMEANKCFGELCYRWTFLITSASCLLGAAVGVYLSARTLSPEHKLFGGWRRLQKTSTDELAQEEMLDLPIDETATHEHSSVRRSKADLAEERLLASNTDAIETVDLEGDLTLES